MNGDDLLIATGVATAIATSISLLASIWWRRADRKEADWITFDRAMRFSGDLKGVENFPAITTTLAQVGDAAAYRVRVVGFGCSAEIAQEAGYFPNKGSGKEVATVIPTGEQHQLTIWTHTDLWDKAFIVIGWIESPTRRKRTSRRSRIIDVRDLAADPPLYQTGDGFNRVTFEYFAQHDDPPPGWVMDPEHEFDRPPRVGWWNRRRARRQVEKLVSR